MEEPWETRAQVLTQENAELERDLADAKRHLRRAHDRIDQLEADLRDQRTSREQMARRAALEFHGRLGTGLTGMGVVRYRRLEEVAAWVLTGERSVDGEA